MEVIFRHFSSLDDLSEYLRGSWQGRGLHGILDLSALWDMRVRMNLSSQNFLFRFHSVEKNKTGILRKFIHFFKPQDKNRQKARMDHMKEEIRLKPAPESVHIDPDLAVFDTGGWRCTFQALDKKRMHAILEKCSENRRVIYFSGSLERR